MFLFVGGLWLASAAWVSWDARRRLRSERGARLVTGGALALPIAGLLLYLLVRPADSLVDRRERRLRRRLLEMELEAAERCLVCRTEVRPEFRCCPGCGEEVGVRCTSCGAVLRFGWCVCPHCEAPATDTRRLRAAA